MPEFLFNKKSKMPNKYETFITTKTLKLGKSIEIRENNIKKIIPKKLYAIKIQIKLISGTIKKRNGLWIT